VRSIKDLINLRGRRAIITGGTGHIGLAVGETLVELGADVAVLDQDAAACEERVRKLTSDGSTKVVPLPCELTDEAEVREAVHEAAGKLNGLDIIVHCAAKVAASRKTGWSVPFEDQSVDAWEDAIRVELTSAFLLTQEARRLLASSGRGSVIFFGSIYGSSGPDMGLYEGTEMGNPVGYGVSKGGVLQLMRYLATILAPGVRVNAISPGGIWRNQPEAFLKRYNARTPAGRMATEEDIKGAVAYLSSDLSAYVTGHNLLVDGGWSAW